MSIPLFNESLAYAQKIDESIKRLKYGALHHKKLVNFIHKYNSEYYSSEQERFISNPDAYVSDVGVAKDLDEDALNGNVGFSFIAKLLIKTIAHYIFRLLGTIQLLFKEKSTVKIIRKSYVDDVEGLFDQGAGVVRLIYPFPLNFKRQLRYIGFLRKNKFSFVFSGLPYQVTDLIKLFLYRDYRHFLKLENRAQILHAIEMSRFKNLKGIQCAEEYEIGSLLYGKMMRRLGISVQNCAHGAGKYLPYHSYSLFDVLTREQQNYYGHFNRSRHALKKIKPNNQHRVKFGGKLVVCLLGQYSESAPKLLLTDEIEILTILSYLSADNKNLVCLYKKHPNCGSIDLDSFPGVELIEGVMVGGDPDLVFQLSLYSTCQIDQNFIGRKTLIETTYIKPALAYGDDQPIVHISELKSHLQEWIAQEGKENEEIF